MEECDLVNSRYGFGKLCVGRTQMAKNQSGWLLQELEEWTTAIWRKRWSERSAVARKWFLEGAKLNRSKRKRLLDLDIEASYVALCAFPQPFPCVSRSKFKCCFLRQSFLTSLYLPLDLPWNCPLVPNTYHSLQFSMFQTLRGCLKLEYQTIYI